MADSGRGKFTLATVRGKTGIITVPARVVRDSLFPLKPGDEVDITIEQGKGHRHLRVQRFSP